MSDVAEKAVEEALAAYLKGTGMESIDPAKFGSAMFHMGLEAGVAQVVTELRGFLPEWNYPDYAIAAICLELKERLRIDHE